MPASGPSPAHSWRAGRACPCPGGRDEGQALHRVGRGSPRLRLSLARLFAVEPDLGDPGDDQPRASIGPVHWHLGLLYFRNRRGLHLRSHIAPGRAAHLRRARRLDRRSRCLWRMERNAWPRRCDRRPHGLHLSRRRRLQLFRVLRHRWLHDRHGLADGWAQLGAGPGQSCRLQPLSLRGSFMGHPQDAGDAEGHARLGTRLGRARQDGGTHVQVRLADRRRCVGRLHRPVAHHPGLRLFLEQSSRPAGRQCLCRRWILLLAFRVRGGARPQTGQPSAAAFLVVRFFGLVSASAAGASASGSAFAFAALGLAAFLGFAGVS